MPFMRALAAMALGVLLGLPTPTAAQDLHPTRRLSPLGVAKIHLGETYVKVTYGRPYIRDRDVFGHPDDGEFLVPYGVLWRTGANEATELTTTGALEVGGQPLAAGTYAIFAIPGPDSWEIRFSPQLGLDGTGMLTPDGEFTPDVYEPERDVLRVSAAAQELSEEVDPFTIELIGTQQGADLVLSWELTEARLPLTVR